MDEAIFVPTEEEKKKATEISKQVIDIIQESTEDLMLKSYIMQMLLESFEETYHIDIRNGISIGFKKE